MRLKNRNSFNIAFLTASMILIMGKVTTSLGYVINIQLIPEEAELFIEVINVILAVVVAIMAALVARLLKETHFENGWRAIIAATVTFAVFEIYSLLEATNVLRMGGLKDLLEFFTISFLLLGMVIIFRSYQHYSRMLDEN